MNSIKKFIPQRITSGLRRMRQSFEYGGHGRFCPVCSHYFQRFEAFGIVPREDARCVSCGAVERHRLFWLFLQRRTDLFAAPQQGKMLHVAPESCFESRLREVVGKGYLTADLFAEGVDVKMDIRDIRFPDGSFDMIYCSHVLEHIPDDKQAMREFRRVLKSDGWAVLLVPITVEVTFEDPGITDPQERLRLFGQEDHVRRYGPDYADRLRAAGFSVSCILPRDFLSEREIEQMGITKAAGELFFCKPSQAS